MEFNLSQRLKSPTDPVMQGLKNLADVRPTTIHKLVSAYQETAGKIQSDAGTQLRNNDNDYRRKKVRSERLEPVKIKTSPNKLKKLVTVNPEKHDEETTKALRAGSRLSLSEFKQLGKKKRKKQVNEQVEQLQERLREPSGKHLLRLQSMQYKIKSKTKQQQNLSGEQQIHRTATRSARAELRKKLAPNYRNMSSGQKASIDKLIDQHPQLDRLIASHSAKLKFTAKKLT